MTDTENKENDVNFASDTAGEFWAEKKQERGDEINIDDVVGTGADGAIKKGDITKYLESLETNESPKETNEPIDGKTLVNLTGNPFSIEGVKIAPKGETALTDDLSKSKRVKHAISTGVLGVK